MPASRLHVLRVFTGNGGRAGNPLGVFLRGPDVPETERQRVARELGFSETVFVEDPDRGELRIFTPGEELPFAGHPLVGTAWLLTREGWQVDLLRPPAGEVECWTEDGLTWIRGRPEWAPKFELRRLPAAADVDAFAVPEQDVMLDAWAWIDEPAGKIRARVFASDVGIAEDEATGAAAVLLGAELRRPITIRQGRGSVIHVVPGDDGSVAVGGRCLLDRVETFAV